MRIYKVGGTFTGGDFLKTKIPRNIKDLSQKGILNYFQNHAISFYGFKAAKIVESLNVELQDIKVQERRTDLVFLLEDDSLLHLEFQTVYRTSDLIRFLLYDALLHEQHKRKVTTVIIYAAGVKRRDVSLKFDTLTYNPYTIFLEEKDGEEILVSLEEKIVRGEKLTVEDILNLDFYFFMKNAIIEVDRAKRLLEVATHITEHRSRELTIATIFGIASKFLDVEHLEQLKEVFMMTVDPVAEFMEELAELRVSKIERKYAEKELELERKIERKMEQMERKMEQMERKMEQERLETAKRMLTEDADIDFISRVTNLEPEVILELSQQM